MRLLGRFCRCSRIRRLCIDGWQRRRIRPINYHVTGALRLAHNRQRMEEFRHVQSMGRALGVAFEEVGADEMRRLYPFLEDA